MNGPKTDKAPRQTIIPHTESWTCPSKHTGDRYQIDIAIPQGTPPPAGWPSIYLLDAADSFGTCVEAVRRMGRRPDATGILPAVVVGISSPNGHDVAQRRRDFTSAPQNTQPHPDQVGGSTRFLAFIEEELKPALAARLPLDTGRRTLIGHSLAGYFALWVLTHHPAAFQHYAAISPSIWWNRKALSDAAMHLKPANHCVFLTVGEWEGALPPWQQGLPHSEEALARRKSRAMIPGTEEFSQLLASVLGPQNVHFELMPNEDHASIVSSAMPRILRFISSPPS